MPWRLGELGENRGPCVSGHWGVPMPMEPWKRLSSVKTPAMASSGVVSCPAQSAGSAAPARLPSFFVIGPPRTGTTWLHEVLSVRTLLPEPTKETRFFDRHFRRGLDWYRGHYPASDRTQVIGEVAPTYFADAGARERIAKTLPHAKVVCIFRNPVERVVSLYRLKRAYAMIPWSFEQAIIRDAEMMESSKYAANLLAWQRALGPGQVLSTIYDDLRDNPQAYVDTLADFIGIERFELPESAILRVNGSGSMTHPRNYYRTRGATMLADWFKARRLDRVVAMVRNSPIKKLFLGGGSPFSELSAEVGEKLCDEFRPDVEALEGMINRDLSAWKSFDALAASRALGHRPPPVAG